MQPDYHPPSARTLDWIRRQIGHREVSAERLRGGITASVDRIVTSTSNGARRGFVLKRWPGDDGSAARELAALAAVQGSGLPAPEPVAVDVDGAATGGPCLLMTEVPGEPELAPGDLDSWIWQAAVMQVRIHALDLDDDRRRELGRQDGWFVADRDRTWIADAGLRRAAVEAADHAAHRPASDVLVHGDYQPFNLLWQAGALTGVADWTAAGRGRRGVDVGHCRLNLTVLFGPRTAAGYLAHYEREAGVVLDRANDLRALLSWYPEWLEFIPVQVAGRARVDVAGMPGRVAATIRDSLSGL